MGEYKTAWDGFEQFCKDIARTATPDCLLVFDGKSPSGESRSEIIRFKKKIESENEVADLKKYDLYLMPKFNGELLEQMAEAGISAIILIIKKGSLKIPVFSSKYSIWLNVVKEPLIKPIASL